MAPGRWKTDEEKTQQSEGERGGEEEKEAQSEDEKAQRHAGRKMRR